MRRALRRNQKKLKALKVGSKKHTSLKKHVKRTKKMLKRFRVYRKILQRKAKILRSGKLGCKKLARLVRIVKRQRRFLRRLNKFTKRTLKRKGLTATRKARLTKRAN